MKIVNGMYPSNPLTMGNAMFNPYYSAVQNPIVPNYPVVQQQTAVQRKVECVNGKESAYTFPMGPNSSVILVDNLSPKIFFVTTDASGYKAVKTFKIIPDEEETSQAIEAEGSIVKDDSVQELMERLNKLEERMADYEQSNGAGQSNSKSFNTVKSSDGDVKPNDRNGQNSKGSNGSNQSNGSK